MALWPIPLPTWFWVWARWRLGRGEFAPYGPCNPAVRPANAPARIPSWAWERLKLLMYGTTMPMGWFSTKGALLRNPRGGVENFVEQRASVRWTSPNVGDYSKAEWDAYYSGALTVGLKVMPWARCRKPEDILNLMGVAVAWAAPGLIVNLETEAKTNLPPSLVADTLHNYTGQVGISSEAWLYNDVNWKPLAAYTCLLQIFPQESEAAKSPLACIAHAKELGFQKVTMTYGTYGGASPNWYDLKRINYSVYTGDDIGPGNWFKWFPN